MGLLRSPSFTEQILPISGAARRGRDLATQACLAWGLTGLIGFASTLASELVSWAISTTSTMMTVVAMLDRDVLYLWVRAGAAPAAQAANMQNLVLEATLIDGMADHWGWLSDGDDMVTWAALMLRTAGPH
ncbi:hypothetical protein ACQP2F_32515 [Actinoplanes sp. CA-030573]|uniref:hypothetical protein n=1 Tax=Actinoplanes sp. CA-030573 TaxID=3239898 RepID=UPI003D8D225A